jgi:hypothetical protein
VDFGAVRLVEDLVTSVRVVVGLDLETGRAEELLELVYSPPS